MVSEDAEEMGPESVGKRTRRGGCGVKSWKGGWFEAIALSLQLPAMLFGPLPASHTMYIEAPCQASKACNARHCGTLREFEERMRARARGSLPAVIVGL